LTIKQNGKVKSGYLKIIIFPMISFFRKPKEIKDYLTFGYSGNTRTYQCNRSIYCISKSQLTKNPNPILKIIEYKTKSLLEKGSKNRHSSLAFTHTIEHHFSSLVRTFYILKFNWLELFSNDILIAFLKFSYLDFV